MQASACSADRRSCHSGSAVGSCRNGDGAIRIPQFFLGFSKSQRVYSRPYPRREVEFGGRNVRPNRATPLKKHTLFEELISLSALGRTPCRVPICASPLCYWALLSPFFLYSASLTRKSCTQRPRHLVRQATFSFSHRAIAVHVLERRREVHFRNLRPRLTTYVNLPCGTAAPAILTSAALQ